VRRILVALYAAREDEARWRIPRVAAIWTHDRDFLGCGGATWTTETLLARLAD
jgi:hypothetical protein